MGDCSCAVILETQVNFLKKLPPQTVSGTIQKLAGSRIENMEPGAGSEDRTRDLKITNLALYQLSYPG